MWASPPQPGPGGCPQLEEVREGFLCPLCLKDLLSVQQLQTHYEEAHSGEEDGHVVGQIRTLLGRAKRKLLKREDSGHLEPETPDLVYTGGVDTSKWEPQDLGVTRNVRSDFQRWRGARINHYVTEVNKLLIRLEKLTSFDRAATDPAKRKALERMVVSWVSDRDVPCCPDCGSHFSLTLRRHHCRLCGSIMCRRCSQFLTVTFARQLTSAVKASVSASGSGWASERPVETVDGSRRASVSSVGSLLEDSGEDDRILSCQHCKGVLEQQESKLGERGSSPIICQLYQKLRSCIARVEELAPEYGKMADSLNAGESTFRLEQAVQLRIELMKMSERIDLLSKKIASLGMSDESPPHPKSLQLQRMIRLSATHFLQEKLLGLTALPSLEKLQELRESRRQRDADIAVSGQGLVNTETGWLASPSLPAGSHQADPLLEQIANIESYLAQAQAAGRRDEAHTLQENLGQLHAELEGRRRGEGDPQPARGPHTAGSIWVQVSDNGTHYSQRGKPSVEGSRNLENPGNPFEKYLGHGNPFEEGPDHDNSFKDGPSNPKEGPSHGNPFKNGPDDPKEGPSPGNPFEEGPRLGNPFEEEEEEEGEIEEELLQQQIDNIKAYIFDAKQASRLDEAASLMDHLGELRRALELQRSRRRPL
ncbi:rabenosyn-5 [Narcine bancroftii]|uniref:rabenosyn-5 n=1 Tax=Narcine bancroftii TaxID=1343680 RepID=UPI0038321A27